LELTERKGVEQTTISTGITKIGRSVKKIGKLKRRGDNISGEGFHTIHKKLKKGMKP